MVQGLDCSPFAVIDGGSIRSSAANADASAGRTDGPPATRARCDNHRAGNRSNDHRARGGGDNHGTPIRTAGAARSAVPAGAAAASDLNHV